MNSVLFLTCTPKQRFVEFDALMFFIGTVQLFSWIDLLSGTCQAAKEPVAVNVLQCVLGR
jgi:hypothetical protein